LTQSERFGADSGSKTVGDVIRTDGKRQEKRDTKARTRIQSADSGTHAETVVPVPMQSKKIVKELAATTLERNST